LVKAAGAGSACLFSGTKKLLHYSIEYIIIENRKWRIENGNIVLLENRKLRIENGNITCSTRK